MTLRTRLFVSSGLVAVPLVVGSFLLDERLRLNAMEDTLRSAVDNDLAFGLKDRCESGVGPPPRGGPLPPDGPRGRGGRPGDGPGPRGYLLYTYPADGATRSADAPALPAATVSTFWTGVGRGLQLRFAIGGSGDCAIGLARLPPRPGQLRDQLVAVALVVLSVLGGVWIAAGSVISRMRRLADDVRQSAASTYDRPVPEEDDDEVAALARAFNDAGATVRAQLTEIQAREETLRQFVANTTHDVAIPMSVLQGHLSSLDGVLAAGGDPGAAARTHLHDAVKETHYMASLLRNLTVATKLGDASAPLGVGPVDLSSLVERVVGRHRPIARATKVELDYAVPDVALVVQTDATLLEQALSNLVDNAVRYNVAGGHVAVVLDQVGGSGFVLSVTDDGVGVADEELVHMTRRWFRGSEARTRRPDGKGLGLAIAAEACERLGLILTFSRPATGGLAAVIATERAAAP